MPTATTPQPATYMADASIAKFSVAQYQKMIQSGALTDEDKVELLESYVVLKMPRNTPHDGTLLRVGKRLGRWLPAGWDVRNPSAIVLSDSQPEPDIAIVREDADDYTTRHPTPADIGLVIEISDTSLVRDRVDKARIYARGNVVCYWIVNLQDKRLEVHTQPSGPCDSPAYASVVNYAPGDSVALVLGGAAVATIRVAELLP